MQSQIEEMTTSGLKVALENKVKLIENQITHSVTNTKAVSTRIFLTQSLEKFYSDDSKEEAIEGLTQSAEKILTTHFSGIEVYDIENNLILSSGVNSRHEDLSIELSTESDINTTLYWNHGFMIRNSIHLVDESNRPIGRITTEEPISDLTRIFKEAILNGKTGDFQLCAPVKESDLEMDCFLRGLYGNQFKRMQRIMHNKFLPIHFALDGHSGIKFTKDYRQADVVAAHSPVAYGLGAVLKIDEKELYSHLTQQIKTISLYLGLLVLIGMALVYWLTVPLIQKTIKSRNTSIKTNKELIQARNNAEKTSSELTAYLDAIGKLALISITDDQGSIIQVNEKFCEISGYSQKELIGQDHQILNSRKHPKSFFSDMWKTITKGQTWHQEICNRTKSGALCWVDSTIVPLTDSNGRIDRYLSVRVDITARKQKDLYLKERLKESNCLQMVRSYLEQDLSTEETCQSILSCLTLALQFPEMAVAIIKLADKQFTTAQYQENLPNTLSAKIIANGKKCGQLQVVYTQDLPFALPFEQNLIDTVAHDLGRWHEHKEAEKRIIEMATHDA